MPSDGVEVLMAMGDEDFREVVVNEALNNAAVGAVLESDLALAERWLATLRALVHEAVNELKSGHDDDLQNRKRRCDRRMRKVAAIANRLRIAELEEIAFTLRVSFNGPWEAAEARMTNQQVAMLDEVLRRHNMVALHL